MQIRWSPRAHSDLDAIINHIILENGESAAVGQARKILASTRQLERFPELGRRLKVRRLHELVVPGTPYIIRYNLSAQWVDLVSITHGAMHPSARS